MSGPGLTLRYGQVCGKHHWPLSACCELQAMGLSESGWVQAGYLQVKFKQRGAGCGQGGVIPTYSKQKPGLGHEGVLAAARPGPPFFLISRPPKLGVV